VSVGCDAMAGHRIFFLSAMEKAACVAAFSVFTFYL
jgi:hypothetical protein